MFSSLQPSIRRRVFFRWVVSAAGIHGLSVTRLIHPIGMAMSNAVALTRFDS